MTISLTVIVVELTNEMTYLLPIMLTITVSQWIGNLFTISMYDIVIYLRKIPFLPPLLPPQVDKLVAEDVMTPAETVVTFNPVIQVREIIRKLVLGGESVKSHNGYPVVQPYESWSGEQKILVVGTITRGQIVALLRQKAWRKGTFVPKRNEQIISPRSLGRVGNGTMSIRFKTCASSGDLQPTASPIVNHMPPTPGSPPHTAGVSDSAVQVSVMECSKKFTDAELEELTAPDAKPDGSSLNVELTEEELDEYLDLTMFMDASPITVYRRTPFRRMYRIFLQMGMRHMCVVGEDSSLLGLVTRKDLWEHAQICLTDSCIRFNMRSGF
jgi:chloride channel 6